MSRWLAGVFDPSARFPEAARVAGALGGDRPAQILDRPPLRVAYSGPALGAEDLTCLIDGHLDNASQIRAELGGAAARRRYEVSRTEEARGVPAAGVATLSCEELLCAGYRRWGRGLLGRLRGDFTLLIWDHERGEGLLARDQLGARPCFLHEDDGRLSFASEIRCLLALLPRRPAPDHASVAHWIAVSSRPDMATLYSGVSRLPPGGVLLLDRGGVREERYWSPRFEEPLMLSEAQLAEETRAALERAVRRRIDPDGLTGVTMSGGLDSSAVAALCAGQAGERILACSATFPEHPAADESELIDTLRESLSLSGLRAEVRPGGLLASALESLAAWQVPLRSWGDFWALPLMRAAARAGAGTILGGDGGDELFGARPYLLADRMRAGHPREAFTLTHRLPGAGGGPPRREVIGMFASLALAGSLPHGVHSRLQRRSQARAAPSWLRAPMRAELLGSDDPLAWKRLDGPRWWAHAAYGMARGIEAGGVFEHHRRRAALAGVESRHPLLDLDLVAFGLRLPPRSTLDPWRTRPVLRASMAGLLPDAVRLRPGKARFEAVIVDCLRGPDLAGMRGLLDDPAAELGAYVELDRVRRTLLDTDQLLRSSPFAWMWQVWRLVTAECWLRAQTRPLEELSALAGAASPARIEIHPA